MNKHSHIAEVFGIVGSACLFLAPGSPAYAANWQDTVRYYLNASDGPTNDTYVGSGTTVGRSSYRGNGRLAANQVLIQSNLTTRVGQLRTLIDANISSGQLSAQTAADLRSQLDQTTSMQSSYVRSNGGLTNDETQQLVDALTNITTQLNNSTTAAREFGLSGTLRLGYNQALMQGTLTTREAQLRTQINAARLSGRVTEQAAANLKAQLEQVKARQSEYVRRQDGMTDEQNQQLTDSLANITVQLNNSTTFGNGTDRHRRGRLAFDQALVQGNLTARDGQLRTQLNANVSSSRISDREASFLRAQLDKIATRQSNYVRSQGGVTDSQYRQLVDALADVGVQLNASSTVSVTVRDGRYNYDNLMDRQSILAAQISQAESNGRISWDQASTFRQQLRDISTEAGRWRTSTDSWRMSGLSQRLSDISERLNNNIGSAPGFGFW